KDGVGRHHGARLAIAITKSFQTGNFSTARDEHHRPRDDTPVDIRFQRIGQPMQALRRETDFFGSLCPRHFECHLQYSYFQNCWDASAAPSAIALNLANTTSGSTAA